MAKESTPAKPATPAIDDNGNKYQRVLSLASQRKRGRGNLDDDYRRPLYEPARPPAVDDGGSPPA